jgi:hypothetical protein
VKTLESDAILKQLHAFNLMLRSNDVLREIDDSNSNVSVSVVCNTLTDRLGKYGKVSNYNIKPLLESFQKLMQTLQAIPALEQQALTSLYMNGCAAWIRSVQLLDPILGMGNGFVDHFIYSEHAAIEKNLKMLSNIVDQISDVITSPLETKLQVSQQLLASTEKLRLRLEGRTPWRYEHKKIRQCFEMITGFAAIAFILATFALTSGLTAYIGAGLMAVWGAFLFASEWQGALQLSNPITGEDYGRRASYDAALSYKTLAQSSISLHVNRSNPDKPTSLREDVRHTM